MEIAFADGVQSDLSVEEPIMAKHGFAHRVSQPACRTPEDVIAFAASAEALIVSEAPVTRSVLSALPKVRIVSLAQVGFNSVDTQAARELGVWVTNVPDGNSTEVACHALAMSLALLRGLKTFDRATCGGVWDYTIAGPLRRPGSLTLGLLGLGRIGALFASYAAPIFGRVLAHDPFVPEENWPAGVARAESRDELLGESDLLSLHIPLTEDNRGMVDSEFLAQMKPGSHFVNVSRGPHVRTAHLIDALDSGHIAGAALDVLPEEPPSTDDPILRHSKVLLSPHGAYYSIESDHEIRRRSIENIAALVESGRPNDVVVEGFR